MTTLKKIIKDAKSLRAKSPKKYSKWTDYVKEASKKYSLKSPSTKKKAAKKKMVVSGIKKKKASKKSVKSTSTLTKVKKVLKQDKKRLKHGYSLTSGNVRIGVIKKMEVDQYNQTLKTIDVLEKSLIDNNIALKQAKTVEYKKLYKNQISQIKKYLSELKIQKRELKKLI